MNALRNAWTLWSYLDRANPQPRWAVRSKRFSSAPVRSGFRQARESWTLTSEAPKLRTVTQSPWGYWLSGCDL